MVDDFISKSCIIKKIPRWINAEIGYVNKLHPAHENEGAEIEIQPIEDF